MKRPLRPDGRVRVVPSLLSADPGALRRDLAHLPQRHFRGAAGMQRLLEEALAASSGTDSQSQLRLRLRLSGRECRPASPRPRITSTGTSTRSCRWRNWRARPA